MDCGTVEITSTKATVDNGITVPYTCHNSGLYTWLGAPNQAGTAPYGWENMGRKCDLVRIDPALLTSPNCHDQRAKEKVTIWQCDCTRVDDKEAVLSASSTPSKDRVLALVRVRESDTTFGESTGATLAEGYRRYCYPIYGGLHSPPVLRVDNETWERLVCLETGQSLQLTVRKPARFWLWKTKNPERESKVVVSYDGERIVVDHSGEQPVETPKGALKESLYRQLERLFLLAFIAAMTIFVCFGASRTGPGVAPSLSEIFFQSWPWSLLAALIMSGITLAADYKRDESDLL